MSPKTPKQKTALVSNSQLILQDHSAVQTLLSIIAQTNDALEALEKSNNIAQASQSIRDARASAEEGLSRILQTLMQDHLAR